MTETEWPGGTKPLELAQIDRRTARCAEVIAHTHHTMADESVCTTLLTFFWIATFFLSDFPGQPRIVIKTI